MKTRCAGWFERIRPHFLAASFVCTVAIGCGCHACKPASPLSAFVPNGPLQAEHTYGDYVVRFYGPGDGEEGSFEIIRNGIPVYAAHGRAFESGGMSDVTGDGQPDLVVSESTGGLHCCFIFHVFEIGSRFRFIQTIDAANSFDAHFVNLDADSALEFVMKDWTFDYWQTCHAGSPAPAVILKYRGQKYGLAGALMRKPAQPVDQLLTLADEIKSLPMWKTEHRPSELWAAMLDLIYSGNMLQAWALFDLAWPDGVSGKKEFLTDFKTQLRKSPFWKDLQELNKGQG